MIYIGRGRESSGENEEEEEEGGDILGRCFTVGYLAVEGRVLDLDSLQQSLAEAYHTLVLVERAMSGYGLKDGIRGPWSAGAGCVKQRAVLKTSLEEKRNTGVALEYNGCNHDVDDEGTQTLKRETKIQMLTSS
ncbi:hypothetical protein RHGRI_031363 [Rhododendron griersonianum]|uniref:Uncharacterized protein n=1 Tax=Rhododendron griersonianum TaxID=479676 RepID=A0AAV6I800_9ERIC|nr:hypothetical protein RHGRI_031363 [Rhododendron griersonianum]